MLYLGTKRENFKSRYVIEQNSQNLDKWPKPIALDRSITCGKMDELLQILNGEGSFFVEECSEIKVPSGAGRRDVSIYVHVLGEIEEYLEHEGPFFRGADGETEGHFSFYKIRPKTDVAVILKQTTSHSYYSDVVSKEGTVYFLKKIPVSEQVNSA